MIGLGSHPTNLFSTSPIFYRSINTLKVRIIERNFDYSEYHSIEIGNDVWIGARATILDGVKIGHGAIIAAGSIVTKDVLPYAIVAGVPAKLIRFRFDTKKIDALLELAWWQLPITEIKLRIEELNFFCNKNQSAK
jgi:acetyltransferase-like isoleucine patch superfamily enzyme